MLTHEEWVNAGRYDSLFGARPPANPARIPACLEADRVGLKTGWYQFGFFRAGRE